MASQPKARRPAETNDPGSRTMPERRNSARREASAVYEQRRQRLLQAAAMVFKRKGLGATSINDIAAEIGSDRASVYYYYASKNEIYVELIRQAVEQIVVIAEATALDDRPAPVRIRLIFESVMDGYERHYPYLHIFVQEDVRRISPDAETSNADLAGWVERFEKAFVSIIEDGIRAGDFRDTLNPHVAMLAMLGTINWSHRWFLPGGLLSGKELGSEFADIYLDGVRVPRKRKRRQVADPS